MPRGRLGYWNPQVAGSPVPQQVIGHAHYIPGTVLPCTAEYCSNPKCMLRCSRLAGMGLHAVKQYSSAVAAVHLMMALHLRSCAAVCYPGVVMRVLCAPHRAMDACSIAAGKSMPGEVSNHNTLLVFTCFTFQFRVVVSQLCVVLPTDTDASVGKNVMKMLTGHYDWGLAEDLSGENGTFILYFFNFFQVDPR